MLHFGGVGRIRTRRLRVESIRIRLIKESPVLGFYAVFIGVELPEPGDKEFEGLSVDELVHPVCVFVPPIEIAHHGNAFRVRRPDPEKIALFAVLRGGVRPHRLICSEIGAVMKKVQRKVRGRFAHRSSPE